MKQIFPSTCYLNQLQYDWLFPTLFNQFPNFHIAVDFLIPLYKILKQNQRIYGTKATGLDINAFPSIYMQHIKIISFLKNKRYFHTRQLEKYNQEPCFKELRLSKSKQWGHFICCLLIYGQTVESSLLTICQWVWHFLCFAHDLVKKFSCQPSES